MNILILGILLGIVAIKTAKRRQLSPTGVAAAIMALMLCIAAVSHASQIPMTTDELVAQSTYIVSGKVVSAEGVMGNDERIYTDVVFEVSDVAKGDLNRGSVLTFSVIGGQYGTLALAATGIPGFVTDEHAVLYLVDIPEYGLIPCGGLRSKVPIYVDPETEEEEVDGTEGETAEGEAAEGETAEGETAEEGEAEGEVAEEGETEGEAEGEVTEEGETEGEAEGEVAEEGEQSKSISTLSLKAANEAKTGRISVRAYMRRLRTIANSQR